LLACGRMQATSSCWKWRGGEWEGETLGLGRHYSAADQLRKGSSAAGYATVWSLGQQATLITSLISLFN
jgi:hypothetical protein